MRNIVTTVENLLPGDTWSDYEGVYVVVAVDPVEIYYTNLTFVAVEDRKITKRTLKLLCNQRFVCDR